MEGEGVLRSYRWPGLAACVPAAAVSLALALGAATAACTAASPAGLATDTPLGATAPVGVEVAPGRGLYYAPLQVTLSSSLPGTEIRYTRDGSPPTLEGGTLYEAPIDVSTTTVLRAAAFRAGVAQADVVTHTYLFPGHVSRQPESPTGWPQSWETHDGTAVDADYGMDPRVVEDPRYAAALPAGLTALPSIALTTAVDNLMDPATGIYANPEERGRHWERPVSVEILSATEQGLQVDAGLRINGNASRRPEITAKHGFRLYFRSEYGPARLNYPLFADTTVTSFDSLVLRPLLDDSVFTTPQLTQYVRDQWIRDTQLAMGSLAPRGRFVHVYLNGLYWGLYNLTERITGEYASDHLGIDAYDIVAEGAAREGDVAPWHDLLSLVDATDLDDALYAQLERRLDLDDFIDYLLVMFYAAPRDWPEFNWVTARPRSASGRFRFFSWDGEWSLADPYVDRTGTAKADTPGALYARLRRHEPFRQRFAARAARHLGRGGVLFVDPAAPAWDPDLPAANAPAARYARLAAEIDDAVVAEAARWGDWLDPDASPYSRDDLWRPERDRMLREFFPRRSAVLADQLRERGLFADGE